MAIFPALFRRRALRRSGGPIKLHVGAGRMSLPGWINVDNQPLPGIDEVMDVTREFPFHDVAFIFAEHFIEHLTYDDALRFLARCRSAMRPEGVLRLTTPNLDWVWMTHYHFGSWSDASAPVFDCFNLNKAFRGWGHQFLYNAPAVEATLREAGFGTIERSAYGASAHPELRGLEKHETYHDTPELSHLLVYEASGRSEAKREDLAGPLADFRKAVALR